MIQIILLIVSVYAIAVGFHGNGKTMFQQSATDIKGFAPWAIAIVLLGILSINKYMSELGKPFAMLFALAVIIKNWSKIQSNSQAFYSEVTK